MNLKPLAFPAILLASACFSFGQDIGVDAGAATSTATGNASAGVNAGQVGANTQVGADTRVGADTQIGADTSVGTNAGSTNVNGRLNTPAGQINAGASADVQQGDIDAATGSNVRAGGLQAGNRTNANLGVGNNSAGVGIGNQFGATLQADQSGLRVGEMTQGSTAASFGLQTGDRILGLNGRTYADANAFNNALLNANANQQAELIYERNGQLFTRRGSLGNRVGVQTGTNLNYSTNRPIYGTQQSTLSGNVYQAPGMVQQPGMSTQLRTSPVSSQVSFSQGAYSQPIGIQHAGFATPVHYGHMNPNCRPRHIYQCDDGEWERVDVRDWDDDDWEDYYEDRRDRMRDRWDD